MHAKHNKQTNQIEFTQTMTMSYSLQKLKTEQQVLMVQLNKINEMIKLAEEAIAEPQEVEKQSADQAAQSAPVVEAPVQPVEVAPQVASDVAAAEPSA